MADISASMVMELRQRTGLGMMECKKALAETGGDPKKAEELAPRDTRKHVETCPFCRGNEHKTPPLILSWPAEGDWQIRMVENLYPVLGDDREQAGFLLRHHEAGHGEALQQRGGQ